MKFLITGITGFVAPHLARELIDKGHEVVGMSRRRVNNDDSLIPDEVDLVSGDMRDRFEIDDVFSDCKFDGVFHLAAKNSSPNII